jgi:hypothetical protein
MKLEWSERFLTGAFSLLLFLAYVWVSPRGSGASYIIRLLALVGVGGNGLAVLLAARQLTGRARWAVNFVVVAIGAGILVAAFVMKD